LYRVANDHSHRASLGRRLGAMAAAAFLTLATIAAPLAASPKQFVAGLWPEAKARGVSKSVFDAALGGFEPSSKVLELTKKQPEFTQTVAQYVAKRITDSQVSTGRDMAGEWKKTLKAIAERYGVQPEVILGIWGVETNFGSYMGGTNTITALATLTYGGYRPDYFRNELLTALQIVSAGHVTPTQMIGSWAGAMGHTQFMPTSFVKYAVDHNGDGRADIWNSVPDALASTANYLTKHGWRPGETWGYEIRLPDGFDYSRAWSSEKLSLGQWQSLGVTRVNGKPFPRQGDMARLYIPTGGEGPAFLLLPNFEVIKSYNSSDSYALTVGHLADRILGGGSFVTEWPNDTALSKAQKAELQQLLVRHGYDVGSPDGVIGPRTRAAIMSFQAQAGLIADGYPSGRLLQVLKRG
jgi:membrane-bound lytic murein transglycosylase B